MKLEVGMYIRTNYGLIGKIIEKYKGIGNAIIYKIDVSNEDFDYTNVFEFEITKQSHNIIDLIEVGDYVNGYKVFEVGYNFQDDYVVKVKDYDYEGITHIYDYRIKSIVTKEQFENISYKIEEAEEWK